MKNSPIYRLGPLIHYFVFDQTAGSFRFVCHVVRFHILQDSGPICVSLVQLITRQTLRSVPGAQRYKCFLTERATQSVQFRVALIIIANYIRWHLAHQTNTAVSDASVNVMSILTSARNWRRRETGERFAARSDRRII